MGLPGGPVRRSPTGRRRMISLPAVVASNREGGSARRVFRCPLPDLYVSDGGEARVQPECIGKGRIRRVHFRMASRAKFQAAEFALLGGCTIAASA